MNTSKESIGTFNIMLLISILGAFLMLVDKDGTVWLKFFLYVMFFLSITTPALFYSNKSCTAWLGRLRKRNRP
ncbi:MAG: hypothetical protein M3R52_09045 [Acidobacteriota bacterium]|nr:hypothetical protein [Acidobacteriota bacterium]